MNLGIAALLTMFTFLAGMAIGDIGNEEVAALVEQQHQAALALVVPLAQYERVVNVKTKLLMDSVYGGLYNGKLERDIIELRDTIDELRTELRICEQNII